MTRARKYASTALVGLLCLAAVRPVWPADAASADDEATTATLRALAAGASHVEAGEADEPGSPARDLDPEALAHRMYEAAKGDDVDAVRQLLDGADIKNFGSALHAAARHESPRAAALLIERGADVNSDGGWTQLHFALLDGRPPGFRVANLLLDHGADVNAATSVMGWTPLHFAAHLSGSWVWRNGQWNEPSEGAHRPDVLQIVQRLIERGADVNARTRVGGWTPVRVARESGGSADVLAALQAAGGRDDGCDDAPRVPVYYRGRPSWVDRSSPPGGRQPHGSAGDLECEYNIPFAVPGAVDAGSWRGGAGSFTAPGADEELLIESVGASKYDILRLAALRDEHGAIRPVMAFDGWTHYEGLCFDAETATHTAVFTRRYDGTCCPWTDTAYYHYDADSGTLAEVFVHEGEQHAPASTDEACRWRDKMAGLDVYEDALNALRAGSLPSLLATGNDVLDAHRADGSGGVVAEGALHSLASRKVPTEVVETQLERLRGLSAIARVRRPDVESPRWKVAVAEYVGVPRPESVEVCKGVLLVWDGKRREWRSIYDCAEVFAIEIHGDTLSAALYVGTASCGVRRQGLSCYLEVDLATRQARLWDYPHGNYWSNDRKRPGR